MNVIKVPKEGAVSDVAHLQTLKSLRWGLVPFIDDKTQMCRLIRLCGRGLRPQRIIQVR